MGRSGCRVITLLLSLFLVAYNVFLCYNKIKNILSYTRIFYSDLKGKFAWIYTPIIQ